MKGRGELNHKINLSTLSLPHQILPEFGVLRYSRCSKTIIVTVLKNLWNFLKGCHFPNEPANFIHRKFCMSQKIENSLFKGNFLTRTFTGCLMQLSLSFTICIHFVTATWISNKVIPWGIHSVTATWISNFYWLSYATFTSFTICIHFITATCISN